MAAAYPDHANGAVPLTQLSPTIYQTEHCLFVIDSSVTWSSPTTAYNDIYGLSSGTFPRLSNCFTEITTRFPASYFSICYIANTGAANVPNYIDRIYKATGISIGPGSSGLGSTGDPNSPQSFSTVDFCRYNLPGGNIVSPALSVFDHELGHAWGAQFFNGLTPPNLSNGHWLPNSTVDCQLGSGTSTDGYLTVNKIYGDPTNGFRWQRVDNGRNNDYQVFSEQTLYLLGARATFPTSYILNGPVFNADLTMGYSTVDSFDHTAAVATYGVRNPDYKTSPKKFKLGFVYIARDVAEVNTVYQVVEQSIDHFCNAEAINTTTYRSQTPFMVNTRYRASVDGLLADLDGNATPVLTVNDTYVLSADGTATVSFSTSDPDGPVPSVSVVPASAHCTVVGNSVQITGLPDGVHFFTLKAADAGGKRAFGHFVVEVQRTAGSAGITSHPITQTAVAGTTATFSVLATGDQASLTYRWYRQAARTSTWNLLAGGGAYNGVDTATLLVAATPAMDGDRFLCQATDATGSVTSQDAGLVVNETVPVLTAQPVDKNVIAGNTTFFRVTVGDALVNYGYYQYQWQRLVGGAGSWTDVMASGTYSGVNSTQITIIGATAGMNGDQFRCLVTNTAGVTTSNVATLAIGAAPSITVQPLPIDGLIGQTVAFSVTAAGTAPLTYQWYRYGTPVGNSATLTLVNIQPADAGTYGVTITNAFGSAFSNNVGLTVSASAPSFTIQPVSRPVVVGTSVTLTVAATGGPAPTFQWRKNGVAIAGATGTSYTIASMQPGDAGNYTAVATNSSGSATSNAAALTVVDSAVRGDLDGDGKADLIWQNRITGERSFWLMNGTAFGSGFAFWTVDPSWQIVGSGDFDGDGQNDLVWTNTLTGERSIWLMNGTTFRSGISLNTVPLEWQIAAVGDFNSDAKSDLVWQNTRTGECSIWLMNGGSFTGVALNTVPPEWQIVASGDFNADGKADLVWTNTSTGERAIWLMNGTSLASGVSLGTVAKIWQIVASGDYNADGKSDLVLTNIGTGERTIWLMDGTNHSSTVAMGTVTVDWVLGRTQAVPAPVQSDFTGDGNSDLVWQNLTTGERSIRIMSGTSFGSEVSLATIPTEWQIVASGDFNADGKSDIVWANTTTGERSFWLMNGTSFNYGIGLGTIPTNWQIVASGDYNGDGKSDLVWSNTTTGERSIWLMNGTSYMSGVALTTVPTNWQIVASGDFNADGKSDLVWTDTATGERAIWLMDGSSFSSGVSLGVVPLTSQIVGTGDFNGDGKSDLVWTDTSTGERTIWLMDGANHSSIVSLGIIPTAWQIRN